MLYICDFIYDEGLDDINFVSLGATFRVVLIY